MSSPILTGLPPQQGKRAAPERLPARAADGAGKGARTGFLRVKPRTVAVSGSVCPAAAASSVALASSSSSCNSSWSMIQERAPGKDLAVLAESRAPRPQLGLWTLSGSRDLRAWVKRSLVRCAARRALPISASWTAYLTRQCLVCPSDGLIGEDLFRSPHSDVWDCLARSFGPF